MVEFPDEEERRDMLCRLLGIENRVYVHVADCKRIYAVADEDLERADGEKTSAVHFLRFELPPEQVAPRPLPPNRRTSHLGSTRGSTGS